MTSLKALIFDLDGTLLNTLISLANSYNRVLSQLKLPTHPTESYRYFIGNGGRVCMQRCLGDHQDRLEEAVKLQQQDYQNHWQSDVAYYAGISELLEQLVNQQIPMAVLSNKDQPFTSACVDHFFPEIPFNRIVGASAETPHKPDPTGALSIVESLELQPEEVAIIGDTSMDIETGVNGGLLPVGVSWGFREREELQTAGAEVIVDHPNEILKLFSH